MRWGDDIGPDLELRRVLEAVPHRRWLFTASIREHAMRCLQRLGIEDMFEGVVSASSAEMIDRFGVTTKHDPRCMEAAMELAGVTSDLAGGCVLLDDSPANLVTAKSLGWGTVLVGDTARGTGHHISCDAADITVRTIHDIRTECPELFVANQQAVLAC